MICDSDRAVTHAVGRFYDGFRVTETIHAAHFRMQMQLHTLFRRRVHTLFPRHLQHVIRVNDIIALVFVIGTVALDDKRVPGAKLLPLVAVFSLLRPYFQIDGACIIRDGNGIDLAPVPLDLCKKYIAPNRNFAGLCPNIAQRCQARRLEHMPIHQLGRRVLQVQSLHLYGRPLAFGLELAGGRRLFQDMFFHGLGRNSRVAHQRHLRPHSGARGDQLLQFHGKFHLRQQQHTILHAHGDVLPRNIHLSPRQKAVNGQACVFQFLCQLQHGSGRKAGICKQALHLECKARELRL